MLRNLLGTDGLEFVCRGWAVQSNALSHIVGQGFGNWVATHTLLASGNYRRNTVFSSFALNHAKSGIRRLLHPVGWPPIALESIYALSCLTHTSEPRCSLAALQNEHDQIASDTNHIVNVLLHFNKQTPLSESLLLSMPPKPETGGLAESSLALYLVFKRLIKEQSVFNAVLARRGQTVTPFSQEELSALKVCMQRNEAQRQQHRQQQGTAEKLIRYAMRQVPLTVSSSTFATSFSLLVLSPFNCPLHPPSYVEVPFEFTDDSILFDAHNHVSVDIWQQSTHIFGATPFLPLLLMQQLHRW